jgi:Peptidase family M23
MNITAHPQNLIRGLRAGLVLLAAALLAALSATNVTAGTAAQNGSVTVSALHLVSTTLASQEHRSSTYDWPLKPFGRQHPVRAFLNDPRIGGNGGTAFHFGIDIAAPDGTAVYAVEPGTVYFDSPRAIAIVAPNRSYEFGYWHIVPAVKDHQFVHLHELLGTIAKGWGHVHFAEHRGDLYLNPLRDGGIGPYSDHRAPTVTSVSILGSSLVAVASDTPDPVVPGAWTGEPVTPALISVKIGGGKWQTAVDFRTAMLPRSEFNSIYTPATRQNHEGEAGCFSFYLVRDLVRQLPANSATTVEIKVSDITGNASLYLVRVSAPEV